MTKEDIIKYEICKGYIKDVENWLTKLPFGIQKFGCSTTSPKIEHELENKHRIMFQSICKIMENTKEEVQKIIDEI